MLRWFGRSGFLGVLLIPFLALFIYRKAVRPKPTA
jgi:hypothetical protein